MGSGRCFRVAAVAAVLAGGFSAAAGAAESGADCAGPPVATAVVDAGGGARPALVFRRDGAAGRRSPSGVVLEGIALPATADEAERRRLAARLAGAAGRTAVVYGSRVRLDRRDRVKGQVSLAGPSGRAEWLQGGLVREGLAVTGPDAGPCAGVLLRLEAAARAAGAGLHARPPAPAADGTTGLAGVGLPAFVVVEGRVGSVGISGGTTYLNFGEGRARDPSARVSRRNSAGIAGEKDPAALVGRRLRVRGWAFDDRGPEVVPSGPEMIETIEERRDDRREP